MQNLARALNELKELGFQTVGLDSAGQETLGRIALRAPLALVLGAEGKGLRQLTRETCDVVARDSRHAGRDQEFSTSRTPPLSRSISGPAGLASSTEASSSEVGTGSREENASN